jgi:hypoxia up-regulated 1
MTNTVPRDKIALNVNADEAAVLGAALYGASLSRQFKTKSMQVADISPYDIQASYFATSSNNQNRPRTITTLLFPQGSKTTTSKTLTFKRKEDFAIDFDYKQPPAHGLPARFMEVDIKGVAEAIGNLTERGAVDPVVKVKVSLSASGFVSVTDAHAYGEIKDESITGMYFQAATGAAIIISIGKLKNLFGVGGSSSEEPSPSDTTTELRPTASAEPSETPASETSGESTASVSGSSKTPEKSAAPKPKEDTISLTVNARFTTISPMTVEEKKAARARLRKVDAAELKQRRKEEARNSFEGYLYRMRDLLDDDNSDTPFKKCSQPSERTKITEKLEELFTWMHEDSDDADTAHFLEKRSSLE